MVEGFDDGQSADAAMSDDLEQENSRLRAQEDNEQLDTAPVGCTGPEVGTMGKWLATRQEARELPGVSTDFGRSGTTYGMDRMRPELVAPGGFEPPFQP